MGVGELVGDPVPGLGSPVFVHVPSEGIRGVQTAGWSLVKWSL